MPEDLMRYDLLAQNALRGVVRDALRRVQAQGLPGDHHFFIQFDTKIPGVNIGSRLSAKYPREMTIVLQHQFFNLQVTEERFQVELSFDNIPEKLIVPFAAVKGFLDPAVQFGLQFEVAPAAVAELTGGEATALDIDKAKPANAKDASGQAAETADGGAPDPDKPKVVSLDSFRKK